MVAVSRDNRGHFQKLWRNGGGSTKKWVWYVFLGATAALMIVLLAAAAGNAAGNAAGGYEEYYEQISLPLASGASVASPTALASTTSIVEPNNPDVHKTATVMAMATGYNLKHYNRFVGSLRHTGFQGNIILVVAPDIQPLEETYLKLQNVTMHKFQHTDCTHSYRPAKKKNGKFNRLEKELLTCVHPYPNLKHRWARFPLLRDLLEGCGGKPNPTVACGGPVLITDMRDTFFQRNPFGPEAPKVHGLQVFEEHYTITTNHVLVNWPVRECKNVHYDKPMLCSGTTIGTRPAMLDYLRIFHGEMNRWMADEKCHFDINGDDQSMHNYMYYSGMLDEVTGGVVAVKNRDGLVHTAGAMGSLIKKKLLRGDNYEGGSQGDFDVSAQEKQGTDNWLGSHYGLTDKDGYFVQFDGSRSYVIHQFDRFGSHVHDWMERNAKNLFSD